VQRAVPHFLELPITNWRGVVENVDGMLVVHTGVTPA
jgi:hypothetical protein